MMQKIATPIAASADVADPSAADGGVDVSGGTSSDFRFDKHIVTVDLSGSGTLEVYLWGLVNAVWGKLCDPSAPTGLLGSAALVSPGVYHFEVDRAGVATRLAFVKGTSTGSPSVVSVTVSLVKERNR